MGSDAQSYAVGFKPAALRDLRKLPRDQQKSIGGRIGALERNPRPPGCEPIKGARGVLPIRAGAYRIVYQPDDTIGHREDIYDELMRRLKGCLHRHADQDRIRQQLERPPASRWRGMADLKKAGQGAAERYPYQHAETHA